MLHNDFSALRSRSTSPLDYTNADHGLLRTFRASQAVRRHKYLLPLVLIAIVTTIILLLVSCNYERVLHTSEAKAAHLAEQQQQKLSAEIKELRTNQTQILSLLQQIAASQTAHSSSSSLQEQDLPDTSEARLESPDSGTPPPVAIPAAVAALPQLTSLHNAVLRSSKHFEHHRAVFRHLLDKLVHLEAAAAQEVRWPAVAAMHTGSTTCTAPEYGVLEFELKPGNPVAALAALKELKSVPLFIPAHLRSPYAQRLMLELERKGKHAAIHWVWQ
jgi:hypothetical protein